MLISCYTQKKHHFLYYFFLFLDATSQPFEILRRLTRLTYPHSRFGVVDSLLTATMFERNTGKLKFLRGIFSSTKTALEAVFRFQACGVSRYNIYPQIVTFQLKPLTKLQQRNPPSRIRLLVYTRW